MSKTFKSKIRSPTTEQKKLEVLPLEYLDEKTFHFHSVKLISKNYDKYFLSISEDEYKQISSCFKNGVLPKCVKQDGDKFSISAYPLTKEEYNGTLKYHKYECRGVFEKSKNDEYYFVMMILEDLGEDESFNERVKERNVKLRSRLMKEDDD